jgi:phospholipase/carboxylesterase
MVASSTHAERRVGELVDAPDYALSFRLLEPVAAPPRRLLLLLHGWDADERQLAVLGAQVDPLALVALPRGPRSSGESSFGWYRVSFEGSEPEPVAAEVEESLAKLAEFVGQLQARHDLGPAATIVAGFSQGGALAAAVALAQPDRVAGFAMFSGRLLPEVEAGTAGSLEAMQAFIAHGRGDTTLEVAWAHRARRWLRARKVSCELHLHQGGHAFPPTMQQAFLAWFANARRGWNS